MEWFKQAKYGMFLCLSPASQVGQAGWQKADDDWTRQWHAKNATLPQDKYDRYMADKFDGKLMSPAAEKLLRSFTAKNFDADKIADLAVAAGMKYIIFTTHHVLGRMYLFKTETSPSIPLRSPQSVTSWPNSPKPANRAISDCFCMSARPTRRPSFASDTGPCSPNC